MDNSTKNIDPNGATRKLAEFISKLNYEDLPAEVVDKCKFCIMDWLGCAIGGSKEDIVPILLDFARQMGGEPQATVICKGVKVNVINAALINGSMSHVLDYDDSHAGSLSHPSVAVAPAVLAMSEYKKMSGKDLILGYVVGFDIMTRVGMAAGRQLYDLGWHNTAVLGRFGAAAGVGKLLKLSPDQMVHALGIAGTQSGGLRQVFGTHCKSFHAGKSAMDGALAAILAEKGFSSSPAIIEGEYGFLDVFAEETQEAWLTDNLGGMFQVMMDGFKPHASCAGTHTTIDAMVELRNSVDLNPDQIESIRLELAKLSLDAADMYDDPKTGLECKFSVKHCAALAVIDGVATEDMFNDQKANDPRISALRKKVTTEFNEEMGVAGSRVTVTMKNGEKHEKYVPVPKGQPWNPMTPDEMENKFRGLARDILSEADIEKLLGMIKNLDQLKNVDELLSLCSA